MVKTMLIAAAAACCIVGSAAQAASGEAETAKFSYMVAGKSAIITLNGTLNKDERAAKVIFAAYDSGKLIAVDSIELEEGETSFEALDCWMTLPYSADRVSVKAFMWTADGKCTPMSEAAQLADENSIPDETGAYGIVTGIRPSTASELPMVSVVVDNGFPAVYPVDDAAEGDKFYQILTGTYGTQDAQPYGGETLTSDDLDIMEIDRHIVKYSIKDGALELDGAADVVGGTLEYDAETMSFGEYKIDESTSLVDIDMYLIQGADPAYDIDPSALADGGEYSIYLADRDPETGVYHYAVISSVTGVGELTPMAIVKGEPEKVTVDDVEYLAVPVLLDGEEKTVYSEDTDAVFTEGDAVAFALDRQGVIRDMRKIVDMQAMGSYDDMFDRAYELLKNTGYFSAVISDDVLEDPSTNEWLGSESGDESEIYFGPIFMKSGNAIQIMTSAEDVEIYDGTYFASYIADEYSHDHSEELILDNDSDTYIYDYSLKPGNGTRVESGIMGSMSDYTYNDVMDDEESFVLWDGNGKRETVLNSDVEPNFALAKAVDGIVTEIVYFLAP